MTGLHYERLNGLYHFARNINVDADNMVDKYFEFAEGIEKTGGKVKCYDMVCRDSAVSIPNEIKKLDGKKVFACVRHGDFTGEVVIGECRYNQTFLSGNMVVDRPNLLIDDPDVSQGKVRVFFDELKGLYIEEESSHKDEGFVKSNVFGDEIRADFDDFCESATTDFKNVRGFNIDNYLKTGCISEGIKNLDGENVLAYIRHPKMNLSCIKGKVYFVDAEIPALTIKVTDKISCDVKLSDFESLVVESKKKDLLSWRPVLHHFYGVPDDVKEARMKCLSKDDCNELQSMFITDSDLEFLYFGGDLYGEHSPVRNISKVIQKIAEHGADEDMCVRHKLMCLA